MKINFPRNLFAIAILLILVGSSCKKDKEMIIPKIKDTETKPTIIIFRDETRFVDENTNALLEVLNDKQLVYSTSNEQLENIEVGDIIVSTKASEFLDHGYIYKVLSVSDDGGKKSFEVEPGGIGDYIIYADIYMSYAVSDESVERVNNSNDNERSKSDDDCIITTDVGFTIEKEIGIENEKYPRIEGSCDKENITADIKFASHLSLNDICVNPDVEIHIRPDNSDLGECLETSFDTPRGGPLANLDLGWIGTAIDWANDVAPFTEGANCMAEETIARLDPSRIEGMGVGIKLTAPNNTFSFNAQGVLDIKLPLQEVIPPALGPFAKKIEDFVDIKLAAGFYSGFKFIGEIDLGNDFSFWAEANFTQGTTDMKPGIDGGFNSEGSYFNGTDVVTASLNFTLLKTETQLKIFGQGGCVSATTDVKFKYDAIRPDCSFIRFESGAKINFNLNLLDFLKESDESESAGFNFSRNIPGPSKVILASKCNANDCLIADYWLDGNAKNQISDAYNGLLDGYTTPTEDRFGKDGGALHFNGIDDKIELNGNEAVITTTEFTIAAWAKMNGEGGGSGKQNPIFTQRDYSAHTNLTSSIGLFAEQTKGETSFTLRTSSGYTRDIGFLPPDYNEWHFYTAVKTEDEMILYIDGKEVKRKSFTGSGVFDESIDYVRIGSHTYEDELRGAFNGDIDDVKIFDCALTEEDIKSLYVEDDPDVN